MYCIAVISAGLVNDGKQAERAHEFCQKCLLPRLRIPTCGKVLLTLCRLFIFLHLMILPRRRSDPFAEFLSCQEVSKLYMRPLRGTPGQTQEFTSMSTVVPNDKVSMNDNLKLRSSN